MFLKFIWNNKRPTIANTIFRKKNKFRALIHFNFKTIVIRQRSVVERIET